MDTDVKERWSEGVGGWSDHVHVDIHTVLDITRITARYFSLSQQNLLLV